MAKKSRKASNRVDAVSQKSDRPDRTKLVLFLERPGRVPFVEFLAERKPSERAEIRAALERLASEGHRLRPPATEHLGGQLYYLRVDAEDGTYRIFYWPSGKGIVVLGHGFSKKSQKCPPEQIARAERMRSSFAADPSAHTMEFELER